SKNFNNMKIVLPWGSEICVRSAERPYTLLGEEVDWLLLSEAAQMKTDVLDRYLRARLVSRKGKLIVPTTPAGKNWLYPLFLRGQNPAHSTWKSWQFATVENPYVDPAEIEEARRTIPEDVFAEQFLGEFVTKTGRVYPEFTRSIHVREFDIEKMGTNLRFFRSFDFGYTNPTAVIFAAMTRDDVLYVFDEYYQRQQTINEISRAIREKSDTKLYEFSTADPSAAREIADLRNAGISVSKATNNLCWGINNIRERLLYNDNQKPRLIIHPKCRNLIFEFEHYKYPEQTAGATLQENPIKAHDHALDALRYLVSALKKIEQKSWKVL
ncbi:MAG: terminase large subunit, partial [Planctomycetes bacterium]|nr:terminase large subunit [Planctomycetota bacterium]